MLFKENRTGRDEALDGALSAWREAEARIPAARLSPGARANIRVLVRQRADSAAERPLANLFLPLGRLAAAAGIPALILAISFGWLIGTAKESAGSSGASISIEKSRKVGGQAVFEIANGGRVHRVHRSNSPRDLGHAELFATTDGTFTDSLAGSGVVYYRID